MRKHLLIYLLLFTAVPHLWAQQYGNEWIDLDQAYFRLTVLHDGIYRIEYNDLATAGVPVDTIDPQNFQLWRRGEEQAIDVAGESDGVFNISDYIEFYGERNDGWQDEDIYTNGNHLNPDFSIYADSSAYFLTWGNPGKRMEEVNVSDGSTTPEPYYYREEVVNYADDYSLGQIVFSVSYNSYWDKGEGWMSNIFQFNPSSPRTNNYLRYVFSGLDEVNTNGTPLLHYILVGRNNQTHVAEIRLDNDIYDTHTFQQYSKYEGEVTFDVNDLTDGSVDARVWALSNGVNIDAQSVAYLRLRYPRNFNMKNNDSLYFILRENTNDTSYIEVANTPSGALVYDISDKSNVRRITTTTSATLNFYINGTSEEKTLYINKEGHVQKPVNITACDFQDDLSVDPDYILITHPILLDGTTEYADYRSSVQGGNYRTLIATIHRLYNQYSYGEVTPLAIRRFARYLYDNGNPEYLVLMGKGVTVDFQVGNRPYYRNAAPDAVRGDGVTLLYGTKDLVPTFGVPASDINFTSTFLPQSYQPAIATGRIPVRDNEDVLEYLAKVKEHEALPYDELWRKNIVHLGGGIGSEAISFRSNLNNLKAIAEGEYFGANVTTFSKSGGQEIEFFNISEEVNNGLSLITFFGHSSPSYSEIDIGNVSDVVNGYENKGRYPMLLINGCSSGNAYTTTSQGEDWITTPEKGAINFLGHSDQGYASQLRSYSSNFYTVLFAEDSLYGGSLGNVQLETIKRFLGSTIIDFAKITQVQQFNLQGDPAINLFQPSSPDYYIDLDRVSLQSFDEEPITAVSDSFKLQLVVDNFGRAVRDTLYVCVERVYNNGQNVVNYGPFEFFPAPFYRDTLSITIQSKHPETYGQNTFNISLDCLDSIPELNEFNNSVSAQYFIPSSGLKTLYPKDFSVIGNATVNFVAQSTDLFIEENTTYVFQLDTNDTYAMPLLELETTARAYPSWKNINLPALEDSLVYYWRARYKDIPVGEDTLWAEASFMYIPGQQGWAQVHFPQFKRNSLSGIVRDNSERVWLYDTVSSFIQATAGGGNITDENGAGNFGNTVTSLRVSGQTLVVSTGPDNCTRDGAFALSFNQNTALPYHPTGSNFDYCGLSPRIVEDWSNGQIGDFANYIQGIPQGDYVLFMAYRGTTYSSWSNVAKDSLKALGAQLVDVLQNDEPYILFVRKGDATPIFETTGADSDTLRFEYTLKGQRNNGTITSPLIGPASDWSTLYQQYLDDNDDEFSINLYGVDLNNNSTLLTSFSGSNYDSLDLKTDVFIDPEIYPYIRLEAVTEDSTDLSIPQLKKWLVLYQGVPEGVIDPGIIGLEEYNIDAVYEGDSVSFNYAFVNISEIDFSEPLVVKYTMTNGATGQQTIYEDTLQSLPAGDTLYFTKKVPTTGLGKENSLHTYVNPKYLPEEYYDNNVLVTSVLVEEDLLHPVLDVTFDGKRILNGEIVSPEPVISIAMQDDNPFLLKGDTAGINIFLRRPCTDPDPLSGCDYERIMLNSELVTVFPATNPKDFRLEYHPEKLEDGVYELLVQVSDVAGNESGLNPYKIKFEVVNKSTITNVLPYPNPFSTSVRFVFTLTGSEIPEDMKIQIMTVTGKVVREIMKEELGVIRIGNNISDYAWDGKDEFGDELANGTYLYRVIIKDDSNDYEHRSTKADQAFKRGFGKMVKIK